MNNKEFKALFLSFLLLSSFIILSLSAVSAQLTTEFTKDGIQYFYDDTVSAYRGSDGSILNSIPFDAQEVPSSTSNAPNWLKTLSSLPFVDIWLNGYGSANKASIENTNAVAQFVKLMALLLIVILIFSSLEYAKFPESKFIRLLISVIVGILATLFISREAVITSMISFTALGTAIWIFIPILILSFFTIMVSSAANPFGIFLQKILWVIYTIYTFIAGLVITTLLYAADGTHTIAMWIRDFIINPLYGGTSNSMSLVLQRMAENADGPTAVILIVSSVFLFWITVIKGTFLNAWIAKEKRDADLLRQQDELERQVKKRQMEAESTK